MRLTFALGCFALATTLFSGRLAAAEPPLQIVTATYLGTAEDDDRQGACAAPDGTIYVGGELGSGLASFYSKTSFAGSLCFASHDLRRARWA